MPKYLGTVLDQYFNHGLCRMIEGFDARTGKYAIDPELVEKAREQAIRLAESQFVAYVEKLQAKVGEVVSAELDANSVWDYSFLTVVLPSGETQIWKTQQIWNYSSLGLHFPQWPTRRVKSK